MDAIERIINQGYTIGSTKCADDETLLENENITIKNDLLFIFVKQGNELVGEAEFTDCSDSFYCENVRVNEGHRRKGIAAAMYVNAELLIVKTLDNHWDGASTQTEEAKALWAMPNRPFGNQNPL